MDSVYQNQVSSISNILKTVLGLTGEIGRIDILWNDYEALKLTEAGGAGNETQRDALIQDDLDSVASFKSLGLTLTQVRDAIYIIKQFKANAETINLVSATIVANLP